MNSIQRRNRAVAETIDFLERNFLVTVDVAKQGAGKYSFTVSFEAVYGQGFWAKREVVEIWKKHGFTPSSEFFRGADWFVIDVFDYI